MPTDTGENNANVAVSSNASNNINKRLTKNGGTPPPEQEHLPCPRCDSTNTKFCYYNNYNFSQPRHFCKSCRRYWTHGGTLRDIPVGGGTRKNAKRSRTAAHNSASSILTANASLGQDYPLTSTPVLVPYQGTASAQFCGGDLKGCAGNVGSGTFTSLLNTQGPGTGFLALGGFGLGLGSGLVGDVGFGGLGRGVWNFAGLGDAAAAATLGGGNGNAGSGVVGGATGMGNTWQFESGETTTGFVGADCFAWPDLAISTPGNGLK